MLGQSQKVHRWGGWMHQQHCFAMNSLALNSASPDYNLNYNCLTLENSFIYVILPIGVASEIIKFAVYFGGLVVLSGIYPYLSTRYLTPTSCHED